MKILRTIALAGASALALSLIACSPPPTSTNTTGNVSDKAASAAAVAQEAFDEISALSGAEREATLIEKAQKEGTLALYTSNVSISDVTAAFKKKYGINVDTYLGTSESVLQRVSQEHQADYFGADVVEGNGTALNLLNDEGLFAEYKSAARDALPPVAQADGWTASRFAVFATAWNTNLIKPADEPKSFEDLADPRFKGMLSMELSDGDWFYTMTQYFLDQGKSQAEIDDLFKKIMANSSMTSGHTQQAKLLAAGQFGVCVACYTDAIDRGAASGAPVTWHMSNGDPVQPLVNRTSGTAMLKTAQHPYAAILFEDFMLGPEVQKLLTDDHRIGSVPTANDPLKGLLVLAIDDDAILKNSAKIQADYAALVKLAGGN